MIINQKYLCSTMVEFLTKNVWFIPLGKLFSQTVLSPLASNCPGKFCHLQLKIFPFTNWWYYGNQILETNFSDLRLIVILIFAVSVYGNIRHSLTEEPEILSVKQYFGNKRVLKLVAHIALPSTDEDFLSNPLFEVC